MANDQVVRSVEPAGQASTAVRLCLLADDLTGACDSAVAFAQRGLRTELPLRPGASPAAGTEVWVRSTATRDVPRAELDRRVAAEMAALPLSQALFKKIDSVFRGNTFDELAAVLRLRPESCAVIAPAFPAAGRTLVGGVAHVQGHDGEIRIPVRDELGRRHVATARIAVAGSPRELAGRMLAACAGGARALLCDAELPAHLDAIVAAAGLAGLGDAGEQPLWVGSGGLAQALAGAMRPGAPAPTAERSCRRGAVLGFIGSDHPVTLAQMAMLQGQSEMCGPGGMMLVPVGRGPGAVRQAVQEAMAGLPVSAVGCLFMTGGDTAAAVCDALGMVALDIRREFAPGVPEARAVGGACHGATVVLKSGGFGEIGLLCRIAQTYGGAAAAPPQEEA